MLTGGSIVLRTLYQLYFMRHALPAQASRGCCPGRAARATSPQNSGRHRLVTDNSVGMSALAGLREDWHPTPRPRHIGRQAEQGCLASAADRGARQKPTALQSSAEALRRKQDSRRQIAASMSHARGRTCPKGPENGLGMGGCADASTPSAIAAPEGRRRKGGWDAWIGYTMLDIFMRAAEAGSPTHREVPVGEGPPIRQRRDRVCQQQPEEGTRPPRVVSRHRASAAGGGQRVGAALQQHEDPLDLGPHRPSRRPS